MPRVASSENPVSASRSATASVAGLSRSRTLRNAVPASGSVLPAAICALANAIPNARSMPITSPVDFISGPRTVSTPGNLMKGNTASLTLTWGGTISRVKPTSSRVLPAMTRAASLASGTPIALLTNGTVRDARGLTSIRNTVSSLTANWTLIRPTTPNSSASSRVWRRISSCTASDSERGGSEQALSPECTPANSMCSMMPPTTTRVPSLSASTSTSVASSRNLSISTGRCAETDTASRM